MVAAVSDLLPCPFCGSVRLWPHLDEWDCAIVECDDCDACGPLARRGKLSDDEMLADAARLWNERPGSIV